MESLKKFAVIAALDDDYEVNTRIIETEKTDRELSREIDAYTMYFGRFRTHEEAREKVERLNNPATRAFAKKLQKIRKEARS